MPAFTIVYTPEAEAHSTDLYRYIAAEASPTTAARFTGAIVDRCEALSAFPERGVPRFDVRPGLSTLPFRRAGLVHGDAHLLADQGGIGATGNLFLCEDAFIVLPAVEYPNDNDFCVPHSIGDRCSLGLRAIVDAGGADGRALRHSRATPGEPEPATDGTGLWGSAGPVDLRRRLRHSVAGRG